MKIMGRSAATAERFWASFEEKYGEKVFAQTMGRYVSGWKGFDASPNMWGIMVATSGGFRFLYMPGENWMAAIMRTMNGAEAPKEQELFVPFSSITAVSLNKEKSWWRRLFFYRPPVFSVAYRLDNGTEGELRFETLQRGEELEAKLKAAAVGSDFPK